MPTSNTHGQAGVPLTRDPHDHPHVFAAAFNTGDADIVDSVYEQDGLLVDRPGHVTSGAERRAANARLLALGLPIEVFPRHVYVMGDIALMIVDWVIAGTSAAGDSVDVRGTATDVARRGPDGHWRYVIDNPFGTATP
ncbi:YybH family protein [Rhodococcus sp. NPDC059234]|uniref:YybH family protein n=1 Tax=Rhodococcus sp. NPDC059234 TaxID=3346781 RepID=UPI0036718E76